MSQPEPTYTATAAKAPQPYRWFAIRPFGRNKATAIARQLQHLDISHIRPFRLHLAHSQNGTAVPTHSFSHDVYDLGLQASYDNTFIFFFCRERTIHEKLQQALYGLGMIYAETINERWTPSSIPQEQIVQFMRVLSIDGRYRILDNATEIFRKGQSVLVTGGKYQGIRGVIYRIQRHKHLIIRLQAGCAIMLDYVPSVFLRPLSSHERIGPDTTRPYDSDSAHHTSLLALNIRLLPTTKSLYATPELFADAIATLEQIRTLRRKIPDIDTRLGLGIGASDPHTELDTLVADLRTHTQSQINHRPDKTRTDMAQRAMHTICSICSAME